MHGVDGLSLTALAVGDRVEILTPNDHWVLNKLSPTGYWLQERTRPEGLSRITPLGTAMTERLITTDWLQEQGVFHYMDRLGAHETELIGLLVWTKGYNLIEPSPVEALTT